MRLQAGKPRMATAEEALRGGFETERLQSPAGPYCGAREPVFGFQCTDEPRHFARTHIAHSGPPRGYFGRWPNNLALVEWEDQSH